MPKNETKIEGHTAKMPENETKIGISILVIINFSLKFIITKY